MTAPIALFVYNRIGCLIQTVYALRKNELAEQSDLFIFSDGGKNKSEWEKIKFIRDYCKEISGFKSVKVIESSRNLGLATSIIRGVNWVLSQHDRVIALEDDLVTSPYFLRFMNDALDLCEKDGQTISISGYVYPIKDLPETFLIRGADCLGWATWKRGWDLFDYRSQFLLKAVKPFKKDFDFNGSYPFYKMLKKKAKGKLDSWAINWYASAYLNDKYTLYPGKSLVKHIGNDLLATHRQKGDWLGIELSDTPIRLGCAQYIRRDIFAKFFRENRPCLKNYIRTAYEKIIH